MQIQTKLSDDSLGSVSEQEFLEGLGPSRRFSAEVLNRIPKESHLRKHATSKWQSLLGPMDFELILKHATSISRTPLESQTYIKLLYRRLPVNHYTKSKEPAAKSCKRCGHDDETVSHAIYYCDQSRQFWTNVATALGKLLNIAVTDITLRDVIYFFPDLRRKLNRDQLHVLNVIHSVALYTLWSSRAISYEYQRNGLNLNWETFRMRLNARLEIEYVESVYYDEHLPNGNNGGGNGVQNIRKNSFASSSTSSNGGTSGVTNNGDGNPNSGFEFSPVGVYNDEDNDDVLPITPPKSATSPNNFFNSSNTQQQKMHQQQALQRKLGVEETCFLNRWCKTELVSVDSVGKVVFHS